MYASFLDRIFGSPPSAPAGGCAAAGCSAEGESGCSASAAPRLGTSDSTQNRATTRPYHCSQNQLPSARPVALGRGDGDPTTMEHSFNASMASLRGRLTGSPAPTSTVKPPQLAASGPGTSGTAGADGRTPSNTTAAAGGGGGGSAGLSRPLAPRTASCSSNALDAMGAPLVSPSTASAPSMAHTQRMEAALRAEPVEVAKLRELSWQGCPVQLRYEVWMFLTGCWSAQAATRQSTISRRRIEYATYIHSSYGIVDWDAVCAMVDSGVDTAVRRSTLKTTDTGGATPGASLASLPVASGSVFEDTMPPELVTGAAASRASLHASPTAASAALEKTSGSRDRGGGSGEVLSSAKPQSSSAFLTPASQRGLQRASVSIEDVRSLLTQPPAARSPTTALESSDIFGADASFSSTTFASGKWKLASSPRQPAGPDAPVLSTPTRPLPGTAGFTGSGAAAFPVAAGSGGAVSHQLSASTMLGSKELQTLKQIRKDIPRMSGGRCYLRHPRVQGSIERVLFIWSLRHPACGYVQGMNDLVVPFMAVVLAYHFCPTRSITELQSYTADMFEDMWSMEAVPVAQWINEIEAEVYWLTSYLLNTMQDNYTSSHEGITAMMRHLAAVVRAADPPLYHAMVDTLQLHFEHFSFRWMNCLLLRELTETQALRLLDAYLSDEERRWSVTHVYVCAALLLRWGPQLIAFGSDYISALKLLQSPPTEQISLRDFQDVLSESFVLQNLYEASLAHLAPSPM